MDQESHFHRPNALISPLCKTVNRYLTPLPFYPWEFVIINPFCCYSVAKSCLILCDPMNCQGPLSFTISQSLLKSIELVTLSNHLILCHPLLLLPLVFPSIRAFSSESVLYIRWPKYWSFRADLFDLSEAQGTLKSLLQHHKRVRVKCVAVWSQYLSIPKIYSGSV